MSLFGGSCPRREDADDKPNRRVRAATWQTACATLPFAVSIANARLPLVYRFPASACCEAACGCGATWTRSRTGLNIPRVWSARVAAGAAASSQAEGKHKHRNDAVAGRRPMTANQAAQEPGERPLGHLAPLKLATMPVYVGLFAYIGPGILWAALAQGSGELIWWPYMTAKYGAAFLGLLILASLLQYWLNLEICRYTIVTGETPMTGFTRIGRWFAWLAWILVFVENIWFGAYASAGGTALAALTGFPGDWTPARAVVVLGLPDDRRLPVRPGVQPRGLCDGGEVLDGGRGHHDERHHLRGVPGAGAGHRRPVLHRADSALHPAEPGARTGTRRTGTRWSPASRSPAPAGSGSCSSLTGCATRAWAWARSSAGSPPRSPAGRGHSRDRLSTSPTPRRTSATTKAGCAISASRTAWGSA